MKQKYLVILTAFCYMLISATLVYAGQITSSHSIISTVPSITGGDVTLNLQITNTGTTDLFAVEATEQSFLGGVNPAASKLIVGDLFAGQSTTLSWVINTTSNLEQLSPRTPIDLMLHVNAVDAGGNAVTYDIISGGTK